LDKKKKEQIEWLNNTIDSLKSEATHNKAQYAYFVATGNNM
tara:strand:+ start:223 stop:345 length:123 start_codon:yes stop_codon:yes gene_type:complete